MTVQPSFTTHHGVMMNIDGNGILIIGAAGIGKSSFALELLHLGHSLIADDVVEFSEVDSQIIAHCPTLSSGFLHSRELGLISIAPLFGESAFQLQYPLDYVVELQTATPSKVTLGSPALTYDVNGRLFPLLQLNLTTPASLYHRVISWIKMQTLAPNAETIFKQRQQTLMNGPSTK